MKDKRDVYFKSLFKMQKILDNKFFIPDAGSQYRQNLSCPDNQENFNMIINRRGHINKGKLTYIMNSNSIGNLIRLDMTGPSHIGFDDKNIPTPHVHIFDEEHNFGNIVVPLSELSNDTITEIFDSMGFFLWYNNVEINNLEIPMI